MLADASVCLSVCEIPFQSPVWEFLRGLVNPFSALGEALPLEGGAERLWRQCLCPAWVACWIACRVFCGLGWRKPEPRGPPGASSLAQSQRAFLGNGVRQQEEGQNLSTELRSAMLCHTLLKVTVKIQVYVSHFSTELWALLRS